jgi:hypothetical protein
VSDTELRDLERRWRESGLVADQAAWIAARLRHGEVEKLDVRLDALRGDEASRLALPNSRSLDRWDAFLTEVGRWFPPIGPNDGVTEATVDALEERLDLELPLSYWEFHRLVGKRLGRFAQDPVFTLGSSHIDGGTFFVSGENQGCFGCGFRLADAEQDDPPVHLVWGDEPDELAAESLATFLAALVLRDAVLGSEHHLEITGDGPLGPLLPGVRALPPGLWDLSVAEAEALEATYPRLPFDLAGFSWRLLGDGETLIHLFGDDRRGFDRSSRAYATALSRTPDAWARLCAQANVAFDDDDGRDEEDQGLSL